MRKKSHNYISPLWTNTLPCHEKECNSLGGKQTYAMGHDIVHIVLSFACDDTVLGKV